MVRAVMDDTGHQGPVDVALDEVDDDFLTDSWNELRPPRRPGTRHRDTDPGTRVLILVGAAFAMILLALPVELDLDASVFVGEYLLAFGADDGGGGQSFGRRFLVCGLLVFGNERDVAAHGLKGVSVRRGVLGGVLVPSSVFRLPPTAFLASVERSARRLFSAVKVRWVTMN